MGQCERSTAEKIMDFYFDQVSRRCTVRRMYECGNCADNALLSGRFVVKSNTLLTKSDAYLKARELHRHFQQLPVSRSRDMGWRVDEETRQP
jgi:hypothetical protein